MKKILSVVILFCSVLVLMGSCKKSNGNKTTCSFTLYGYTGSWRGACSFGSINPAAHTLTSVAAFTGNVYSDHNTYNTSDHCFYFFEDGEGSLNLYKMSLSGTLTTYTNASGTAVRYDGIIYDPATNKLYAIKTGSGVGTIVELVLSGTTFSETILASTAGVQYWASPASTAVNTTTGTIYYALRDVNTNIYSIEKYTPGATSATVITSGTNSGILGLQFNRNDNMLYAVREGSSPQEFIKIDPASGSITSFGALGFDVDNESYSSIIDACSNRYILTSDIDSASCTFSQISMTGTILQHDTATGIYQGLEVVY